ncbi:hypothetical protein [Fulvivirga sedimenti]|uniref:Uncharacterized protein n=1 Tax=Fulvivirga sedimenti TaxID=2879465 RepID=A0A9X1HPU8_9BACT|nr:hypothetical protein [Fulvivirga sedimenti]MCA6074002.1 hypothetical protein [Fulvivirga sedimenti]
MTAIHGFVLFFLSGSIITRLHDHTLKIHGWISLSLKLLAGILIGLLYSEYYDSGDTYLFYGLGEQIAEVARLDFGRYLQILAGAIPPPESDVLLRAPRLFFMVKIVSVLNLLTMGNYWISGAYLSFFCWLGMFRASVIFIQNYPSFRNLALIAGLYLPSVVFWSAGLTKESIAMGLFGLLVAKLLPGRRKSVQDVIIILLLLAGLWSIKYYYALPLIFAFGVFYMLQSLDRNGLKWYWKSVALLIASVVLFAVSGVLNINFEANYFPQMLYENYQAFQAGSDPGSALVYANFCDEWQCILLNFPSAVWGTLFRPYVWELHHLPGVLAGLENLLYLALFPVFLLSLISIRRWTPERMQATFAAVLFILIIAGFLGLSTPNFGTLDRYRIIILPVFIIVSGNSEIVKNFLERISLKRFRRQR